MGNIMRKTILNEMYQHLMDAYNLSGEIREVDETIEDALRDLSELTEKFEGIIETVED